MPLRMQTNLETAFDMLNPGYIHINNRQQTLTLTDVVLLPIRTLGTNRRKIQFAFQNSSLKTTFDDVVCKMSAIFLKPHWVN